MPHSTQESLYNQQNTEIPSNIVCTYKTEITPDNSVTKGKEVAILRKVKES